MRGLEGLALGLRLRHGLVHRALRFEERGSSSACSRVRGFLRRRRLVALLLGGLLPAARCSADALWISSIARCRSSATRASSAACSAAWAFTAAACSSASRCCAVACSFASASASRFGDVEFDAVGRGLALELGAQLGDRLLLFGARGLDRGPERGDRAAVLVADARQLGRVLLAGLLQRGRMLHGHARARCLGSRLGALERGCALRLDLDGRGRIGLGLSRPRIGLGLLDAGRRAGVRGLERHRALVLRFLQRAGELGSSASSALAASALAARPRGSARRARWRARPDASAFARFDGRVRALGGRRRFGLRRFGALGRLVGLRPSRPRSPPGCSSPRRQLLLGRLDGAVGALRRRCRFGLGRFDGCARALLRFGLRGFDGRVSRASPLRPPRPCSRERRLRPSPPSRRRGRLAARRMNRRVRVGLRGLHGGLGRTALGLELRDRLRVLLGEPLEISRWRAARAG